MELTIVIGCQRAIEKQALPKIMMPYDLNLKALNSCCANSVILFFINFPLTGYSVYAFCVYNVAKLKHLFEKGVFYASVPRPYYRFSVLT